MFFNGSMGRGVYFGSPPPSLSAVNFQKNKKTHKKVLTIHIFVCYYENTNKLEVMKMNFKEALKKLIKDNNKSHASLSELIGRKNPTFISNMVSRGNCNVDTLLEITDALGYEIVIKPKSGENKAERTIRLER